LKCEKNVGLRSKGGKKNEKLKYVASGADFGIKQVFIKICNKKVIELKPCQCFPTRGGYVFKEVTSGL